jgi:hypothetical protein
MIRIQSCAYQRTFSSKDVDKIAQKDFSLIFKDIRRTS